LLSSSLSLFVESTGHGIWLKVVLPEHCPINAQQVGVLRSPHELLIIKFVIRKLTELLVEQFEEHPYKSSLWHCQISSISLAGKVLLGNCVGGRYPETGASWSPKDGPSDPKTCHENEIRGWPAVEPGILKSQSERLGHVVEFELLLEERVIPETLKTWQEHRLLAQVCPAGQSEFAWHSTHKPVTVLQVWIGVGQFELLWHPGVHKPLLQKVSKGQFESVVQPGIQRLLLQKLSSAQSVLVLHSTHSPLVVLHTVPVRQLLLVVHPTHCPRLQMGLVAGQLILVVHPATQMLLLQICPREQSEDPKHWVQVLVNELQRGAVEGQFEFLTHCTQRLLLVLQTSPVAQFSSLMQPGTHTVPLQYSPAGHKPLHPGIQRLVVVLQIVPKGQLILAIHPELHRPRRQ
jgi:hypothetical protein